MKKNATILIVEDSPTLNMTYGAYLESLKFEVLTALNGKDALETLEKITPALLLLDLKLPDMDGMDILKKVQKEAPDTQTIVITAHGSVAVAVEAMQEGAFDFLLKPFNADRLLTTVNNAIKMQRLTNLVEHYQQAKQETDMGGFIGNSPAMQSVYRMIHDAAPSNASVFVVGESGTGKELCAENIHQLSKRRDGPFVALNCAAIPSSLIESEIFGHKRGAFTGATEDRVGAAMRANGGTLFLDEVCEMPIDLQSKLLRFIQTGQITPVGDGKPRDVDVRFVCATNRNPWLEVRAGRFREDLYYRLHVIPILLPPLKDRSDDVIQIANALLRRYASEEGKLFQKLSPTTEAMFREHGWPGNVRELGNVIQSAVVLNDGEELTPIMLPPLLDIKSDGSEVAVRAKPDAVTLAEDVIIPLEDAERAIIKRAITVKNGSIGKAAKALGVNPSTLYRKIKSWQS